MQEQIERNEISARHAAVRVITLPALHRQVSLKTYLAGVKLAISQPDQVFKHGLTCWWSCTGREIRRQFRDGMHDRINQGIPYPQRGL